MENSTEIATAVPSRIQVCMSFTPKEEKVIIRKYKAYVAKCTGPKILAKAAWAKTVLLS